MHPSCGISGHLCLHKASSFIIESLPMSIISGHSFPEITVHCHSSVATPFRRSLSTVVQRFKEPLLESVLALMPSQPTRLSSFLSLAVKAIIHQAATPSRSSLSASPFFFCCSSFTHRTAAMSSFLIHWWPLLFPEGRSLSTIIFHGVTPWI